MLYRIGRDYGDRRRRKSFVADVNKNDLLVFSPAGSRHSIQALTPMAANSCLCLMTGFSGQRRLLLSDAMAAPAARGLSKNFGVGEKAFQKCPKQELFIFQTGVPSG